MCIAVQVHCPLFLSDFNESWILSTDIRKILKSDLMTKRQVGTEFFHADMHDRQKELSEKKFSKAPNNVWFNLKLLLVSFRATTHCVRKSISTILKTNDFVYIILYNSTRTILIWIKIPKFRWKSEFRQNYRTNFSPTIPPFAARISRFVADVQAPGGEIGNV